MIKSTIVFCYGWQEKGPWRTEPAVKRLKLNVHEGIWKGEGRIVHILISGIRKQYIHLKVMWRKVYVWLDESSCLTLGWKEKWEKGTKKESAAQPRLNHFAVELHPKIRCFAPTPLLVVWPRVLPLTFLHGHSDGCGRKAFYHSRIALPGCWYKKSVVFSDPNTYSSYPASALPSTSEIWEHVGIAENGFGWTRVLSPVSVCILYELVRST